MEVISSPTRHPYMARICVFVILVALLAGMVSCGDGGGIAKYSLTMAVAGGNGTATDLTGASPYEAGTVVSIKAVAGAGYHFANWTAPAGIFTNATAAQTTFTMPAQNVTVTANFIIEIPPGAVEVRTWHDLDAIRNDLDGCFILVNDLDASTAGYEELASPTANGEEGWQTIDDFAGSFDGQGHEICNLFISRPNTWHVGLFSNVLAEGFIGNVGVTNTTVVGGVATGSLVGDNYGTVNDCYAVGSVTGAAQTGGLIGVNYVSGAVSDSYFIGTVGGPAQNSSHFGGLAGYNSGIVNNCHSTGIVSGGSQYIGGLIGFNVGTIGNCYSNSSVNNGIVLGGLVGDNEYIVSDCYATGSVVTSLSCAGGLVGQMQFGDGVLHNSYSTGSVTGGSLVGGLIGSNNGTVNNCYATGDVTGIWYVAGLVGANINAVLNCYALGYVTYGSAPFGGLVADNSGPGTVTNSFWDTETSGQGASDGGTGKNTTEMKDMTTFSGAIWNITAVANPSTRNLAYIWNIVNAVTYPFLSWQP